MITVLLLLLFLLLLVLLLLMLLLLLLLVLLLLLLLLLFLLQRRDTEIRRETERQRHRGEGRESDFNIKKYKIKPGGDPQRRRATGQPSRARPIDDRRSSLRAQDDSRTARAPNIYTNTRDWSHLQFECRFNCLRYVRSTVCPSGPCIKTYFSHTEYCHGICFSLGDQV